MEPDYDTYSLDRLIDARKHIDAEAFPERAAELDARIAALAPQTLSRPSFPPRVFRLLPELRSLYAAEFEGDDRMKCLASSDEAVTLDREHRLVSCATGREVPFDDIVSITVTGFGAQGLQMPSVWINPRQEPAIRIAAFEEIPFANRFAMYVGDLTGVSNVQVL